MPREFVIVSPEPITLVECATATNSVDPGLGLGRLWKGGGLQIASDDNLVLAVLRSSTIENPVDAERMWGPLPANGIYATEAYGPFGSEMTVVLAKELATCANGTLIAIGEIA